MRPVDRRLLGAGGVARAAIGVAVGVGVLGALLAVAQAALLAHVISRAFLEGADLQELAAALIALAVVLACRAGIGWASEVAAHRISGRVKADLRAQLLGAAVRLGPREAASARSGEIALLATRGLDALDGWFARVLPQAALAGIVPVAVVLCLLVADPLAALTVALTVPLIPVFMVLIGRMSATHRARRWATLAVLGHRFLDVVAGLPTLRAFGRADAQVDGLRRTTDAWRTSTMATLRVAFLSALALELLATISVALVAVGVGLRLDAGTMALETGLFAIVLAPEAYLPLRRLGAEFHASEEGIAAAREAFTVIDGPAAPIVTGVEPLPGPPTAILVEDLWVEQPGRAAWAPGGVGLSVAAGEIVAVVGPSGAGKSTLLLNVLGLVEPTHGSVSVVAGAHGPYDLQSVEPAAWRRMVAWVPQVPVLVAGTVADNVRLACPAATDAEVRVALDAVGLGDLDPGDHLGERGAGLSSGQRRRVGVARALVRRLPVLLLDEPTAGLDEAAEATVLRAIRRAADDGALVLLVAHRPAAAALADRVVTVGWRSTGPEERVAPPGVVTPGAAERPGATTGHATIAALT